MSDAPAAPPAGGSEVETLKRIRAAETDAEERLVSARRAAEATLSLLREQAAAAVASATAEAEGERVHAVEAARTEADAEAAQIVADGERAAGRLDPTDAVPGAKRAAVLRAVLGDLGGR